MERLKSISGKDSNINFEQDEFQGDLDSTVLVRERTRGTKLEPAFRRKKGEVVGESKTTVSILREGEKTPVTMSKRIVAVVPKRKNKSKTVQILKRRDYPVSNDCEDE